MNHDQIKYATTVRGYFKTMTDAELVDTIRTMQDLSQTGVVSFSPETIPTMEAELRRRMDDHLSTFFGM